MRTVITITLLSILLMSCVKKKPKNLANNEARKIKLVLTKIDGIVSPQIQHAKRDSAESYIMTNDSLIYMGVEVYEDSAEITKIKYWATFNSKTGSTFNVEHKGTDYTSKNP